MTDWSPAAAELLDRVVPPLDLQGDWDAVLSAATRPRRPPSTRRGATVALAAAVLVAAVLAWPASGPRGGVLDRALAAVGDGPVLHVVLEGSWGGDLVDLRTEERTHVPGIDETWYEPGRNLVRRVSRLGDAIQSDETYRPGSCTHDGGSTACFGRPGDIAALGREYRDALESGTARVRGEGVVQGSPVYWIVVHHEDLPDVADGKVHPWTQQVAVSQATYEPVATRETRDGVEGYGTRQLVRTLEYTTADAAGFGDPAQSRVSSGPMYFSPGFAGPELTLADARDLLGRAPLWSGRDLDGLPLARIAKEEFGRYDPATRTGHGIVGAVFVYGHLNDVRNGDPLFDGPYAIVRETATSPAGITLGNLFVPPAGRAFVSGNSAVLRRDGLYVRIEATSAELALAVARELRAVAP
jgi:hypothetical protein